MAKKTLVTGFYYPALDGLRFVAFLSVFLHHFFQIIQRSDNAFLNYLIVCFQKNGWVGVVVWLGKISFGLYVWHPVSLSITLHLVGKQPLLLLLFSLVLTVGMAALSYYFYEYPFLKLKSRFTKVRTRQI